MGYLTCDTCCMIFDVGINIIKVQKQYRGMLVILSNKIEIFSRQTDAWRRTLGTGRLARDAWRGTLGAGRLARNAWHGTLSAGRLARFARGA